MLAVIAGSYAGWHLWGKNKVKEIKKEKEKKKKKESKKKAKAQLKNEFSAQEPSCDSTAV